MSEIGTAGTVPVSPDGEPPVLTPADLPSALAAARAEGWPVDLEDAVLHDDGWENLVLETRDGWIVRFPRPHAPSFTREVAVLGALGPRLSVPTPSVEHVGTRVRAMVYRALTGARFDGDVWRRAGDAERDAHATSLAALLAELHAAWTVAEAAALGVPRADLPRTVAEVRERLGAVPADLRAPVERICAEAHRAWVADPPREPDVVLHSDVHHGNLVLSDPIGSVVGLWDFSCVQIGPPSLDLRYLAGYVPGLDDPAERLDLAHRVARSYLARTGRRLDPERAALALRVEDVHGAVLAGDEPWLRRLVGAPRA